MVYHNTPFSWHEADDPDYTRVFTRGGREVLIANVSSRVNTLERSLNWHVQRAEALSLKLEAVKQFGEDDWEEETVIRFDKVFKLGGRSYSYAMIKVNGLWYSTGPKAPKAFTWSDMIAWLLDGEVPTTVLWVVDQYRSLDEYS